MVMPHVDGKGSIQELEDELTELAKASLACSSATTHSAFTTSAACFVHVTREGRVTVGWRLNDDHQVDSPIAGCHALCRGNFETLREQQAKVKAQLDEINARVAAAAEFL